MIMIVLCSALIGAVLGTRFRVQVLFPATAFGILVVAFMAASGGWSVWSAIRTELVSAVSLQIGYLGGLLALACMMAARVPLRRTHRSTVRG